MTTSEAARHVRAEPEAIAAGLRLQDLARLLEFVKRLAEDQSALHEVPIEAAAVL